MLADNLLKTKKEYKDFKNRRFKIYLSNELDKVCFQHDMAYQDIKDLPRNIKFT